MKADSEGNPFHNNIHLIKQEENTDLDEVNSWMDWSKVGGLRSPAPADFLGGVNTYDAIPGKSVILNFCLLPILWDMSYGALIKNSTFHSLF